MVTKRTGLTCAELIANAGDLASVCTSRAGLSSTVADTETEVHVCAEAGDVVVGASETGS